MVGLVSNGRSTVGVSAATGEGFDQLVVAIENAAKEFERCVHRPSSLSS